VTIALQVLITGLAAGGVYGLFAAGHSLIYRLTGIVHFAFGDLVGLGVFATLLVLAGTAPVTRSGAHEPRFVFALAFGLVLCVAAGVATYVGLVQPYLARGSTIGWVAGTAAVAFAIRDRGDLPALELRLPGPAAVSPGRRGRVHRDRRCARPGAGVLRDRAGGRDRAGVSAWLLERSRFGRGLRAVADDAEGRSSLTIRHGSTGSRSPRAG
jgi:branched-chain amino acid transport system permease protein